MDAAGNMCCSLPRDGSGFISLVGLGADGLPIETLEPTWPDNHSIGR